METQIKEPTTQQSVSIAETLKDRVLRDWSIEQIKCGIRRVSVNEAGIISVVYVSQGLFRTLCHYHFGDRTLRAFAVGGYWVKSWRPNQNGNK